VTPSAFSSAALAETEQDRRAEAAAEQRLLEEVAEFVLRRVLERDAQFFDG